MKYDEALDLQQRMAEMVRVLQLSHIDVRRVRCFRSKGSSTKRTLARCHALGKLMQKALSLEAHYTIEFLERFDQLPRDEQDKVIIHELMHIPKTFGGGFRQHDFVCDRNVEVMHARFVALKRQGLKILERAQEPTRHARPFSGGFLTQQKEHHAEVKKEKQIPFFWR